MSSLSWNGYVLISVDGKQVREHRKIWEDANGPIPPGKIVHHLDGNKTHNVLENLVLTTRQEHPRIHFSKPKKPCLVCPRDAKAHGLCTLHCKEVKKYGRLLTSAEHQQNRRRNTERAVAAASLRRRTA